MNILCPAISWREPVTFLRHDDDVHFEDLKISDSVNRRRTENTMAKRKRTSGQTKTKTIYKTST